MAAPLAFKLPKLPKLSLPKGKHRRTPGAHRDAAGRPHPHVQPGGSARRVNQSAREDERYRGTHAAGQHRRPRPQVHAQDPFSLLTPPAVRAVTPRTPRPVMGQPAKAVGLPGRPRDRFGPRESVKVTDLAPSYRAAGQPARTRREQAAHELSRDAMIRATKAAAAEKRKAEDRARAAALRARVEAHEERRRPPVDRSKGHVHGTARSRELVEHIPHQRGHKATGRAARPAAGLPGDPADREELRAGAARTRKGSEHRDPAPKPSHPFFSGGLKAAPSGVSWRDAT